MKRLELDPTAKDTLLGYHWPGNARELENVIERAAVLSDKTIKVEHLGIEVALDLQAVEDASRSLTEIGQMAARKAEIATIVRALDRTNGNKSRAAEALGVSYKTLLNKVKEYGIELPAR